MNNSIEEEELSAFSSREGRYSRGSYQGRESPYSRNSSIGMSGEECWEPQVHRLKHFQDINDKIGNVQGVDNRRLRSWENNSSSEVPDPRLCQYI